MLNPKEARKAIIAFLEDCIYKRGALIEKLDFEEKRHLAGLMIMADDSEFQFEVISEAQESDSYPTLLARFLVNPLPHFEDDMIEKMAHGAMRFLEKRMQFYIDYANSDYEINKDLITEDDE